MLRDSDTHYISDHSSLMEVTPPEFQSQIKGLCFLYKKDEETGHATIYTSTHIMGFFYGSDNACRLFRVFDGSGSDTSGIPEQKNYHFIVCGS